MAEITPPDARELPDSSRLIALTDGLFATVLTVLVLSFHFPEIDQPNLVTSQSLFFQHLVALSPSLVSYVLTFLVAGSYWQAHHNVFETIPRVDRRLLWYNLMFLLCVGLLPFSTQLLNVQGGDRVAWSAYCINMILIGMMFTLGWGYAISHGLRVGKTPPGWKMRTLAWNLTTPLVFLGSLIVGQFQVSIAYFFPVLIPLMGMAVSRLFPVGDPEPAGGRGEREGFIPYLFWRVGVFLPVILFGVWLYWSSTYYQPSK
jgi:uncharacterized membrane protein